MEQNTQPNEKSIEVKLDGEGEPISSNSKKPLSQKAIVLILIVVLLIVFGVVYFLFFNKEDSETLPAEEIVEVVKDETAAEVEIDKTIDTDHDGLPNYLEKILGTNENNRDTDGDSYDDYSEIKNGYNPLNEEKYTEEEWGGVKELIKSEDEGLFGEMFLEIEREKVDSESLVSDPLTLVALSEDKKTIVASDKIILNIDNKEIYSFFQNESGLCNESNIKVRPTSKTFCEDREIFRSKTRFTSIVISRDEAEIGFTIESDELSPDKVAGIFYPFRTENKIYFLTSYYLGNEFIDFSPTGKNFAYRYGCFEGFCGLAVEDSETLEDKISFSSGDGGVLNYEFVRWISDNEIEYKLDEELMRTKF